MERIVPALVGLIAATALTVWLSGLRAPSMPTREPGADLPPGAASKSAIDLRGIFTTGKGLPADLPGSWPCFRGPDRDGFSREAPRLANSFSAEGPRRLWSLSLGFGYAAPAVAEGRVYVLDYDQTAKADALRCLSLADGTEIWRRAYPVTCKFNHGMSRTVPAVADGAVVSIGPRCHVLCCDALTGDYRWGLDLVRDFGTKEPPWYAGQCPLIDQGAAIIAPAGPDVLIMAVDLKTGQPRWKTPNPRAWKMTHVSLLTATMGGQRMYVYAGSGGVVAVAAEDGRILWETDQWKVNIATVPTPIQVDPERIFCCGGYGSGAAMLKIIKNTNDFTVTMEWRIPPNQFGSDQQTPVFFKGLLYGVVPDGQLVCLGLDGKRRWSSGVTNRFGLGPYLIADNKVLVVNDTGTLTLAEATVDGWKKLAQAKVLDGHDAWGPLALTGTRLLARDLDTLVCVDLAPLEGKP